MACEWYILLFKQNETEITAEHVLFALYTGALAIL